MASGHVPSFLVSCCPHTELNGQYVSCGNAKYKHILENAHLHRVEGIWRITWRMSTVYVADNTFISAVLAIWKDDSGRMVDIRVTSMNDFAGKTTGSTVYSERRTTVAPDCVLTTTGGESSSSGAWPRRPLRPPVRSECTTRSPLYPRNQSAEHTAAFAMCGRYASLVESGSLSRDTALYLLNKIPASARDSSKETLRPRLTSSVAREPEEFATAKERARQQAVGQAEKTRLKMERGTAEAWAKRQAEADAYMARRRQQWEAAKAERAKKEAARVAGEARMREAHACREGAGQFAAGETEEVPQRETAAAEGRTGQQTVREAEEARQSEQKRTAASDGKFCYTQSQLR
jgi:hypothetical protein